MPTTLTIFERHLTAAIVAAIKESGVNKFSKNQREELIHRCDDIPASEPFRKWVAKAVHGIVE